MGCAGVNSNTGKETHMSQQDVVRRAVRCHVAVTSSHGQQRGGAPKLFKSLLQSRTNGRGSELGTSADRRHRQTISQGSLKTISLVTSQQSAAGHTCNPSSFLYSGGFYISGDLVRSSAEVKMGGSIPPLSHTSSWRGA
jgi:hypothetical protein